MKTMIGLRVEISSVFTPSSLKVQLIGWPTRHSPRLVTTSILVTLMEPWLLAAFFGWWG